MNVTKLPLRYIQLPFIWLLAVISSATVGIRDIKAVSVKSVTFILPCNRLDVFPAIFTYSAA